VLLTRAPLYRGRSPFSCDLHVLGAPLTFVLSQDQTLQLDPSADTSGAKPPAPPYSFTMISLTAGGGVALGAGAGGAITRDAFIAGMRLSFQGPRGFPSGPSGAWNLVLDPTSVKRKSILGTRRSQNQ
jgi:hypothetical protein